MAAQYLVLTQSLTDDVVTLELSATAGLYTGWSVHVAGLGHPYDGTHTLTAVDATLGTVEYHKNHADEAETSKVGQLHINVQWIDTEDVEPFLGVAPASQADEDWLQAATDAANIWCYNRRQAAGYTDLPGVVPDDRVKAGTVLKAAELYRSRGSIDGFASFQQLEGVAPIGSNAEVLRLLGINRPAIA